MKKVPYALSVLMLILSVASLSSCKKDKKTTPVVKSTVTADIDGKATDFSSFAIVLTGSTNGNNFTAIQGDAADGSSISVSVYGTLTAGKTYTIDGSDFGTGPAIAYSTSNGDTYLPDENSSTTLSVTITAVSASSIQGSFKGELAYVGSGAKPGKSVTNGKFNVQR
ncbi:hypothetical protein [Mucilaginibacter ginsenosidivorans]|uniref:Uncharacterized protein n=1 Tax=Mucilaginibacter ginsenosidivorans TaxID=398053 RepID=A0A5B8V100_9SPHI|nr:hypothetical protein [Mucilaginibacter ginsenosidivorans]QEC65044.1 hypothetical protein FRZ54_21540 [Mucilaginibacter ginsenosidivorans]